MKRVLLSAIHVRVLVTLTASAAATIVTANGAKEDAWMMMIIMGDMEVMIVRKTAIADIRDALQIVVRYHVDVLMSVVDAVAARIIVPSK